MFPRAGLRGLPAWLPVVALGPGLAVSEAASLSGTWVILAPRMTEYKCPPLVKKKM